MPQVTFSREKWKTYFFIVILQMFVFGDQNTLGVDERPLTVFDKGECILIMQFFNRISSA